MYKTYFGGAGFILVGVGNTLKQLYEGVPVTWEANMTLIFTGITIIGGRNAYANKH